LGVGRRTNNPSPYKINFLLTIYTSLGPGRILCLVASGVVLISIELVVVMMMMMMIIIIMFLLLL
jgi:hypothetical protein